MADIEIRIDASGPLGEMRRLEDGPGYQATLDFEHHLETLFQEVRAYVHVRTGSLRSSIARHADWVGDAWTGEIVAGGSSTGPKNPVKYAQIERARGVAGNEWGRHRHIAGRYYTHSGSEHGDHNFMRPTELAGEGWIQAIIDFYDNTHGDLT